jgi:hypothetical protein
MNVWHRFYSFIGYKIEIRVESPAFQAHLKRLSNLLDDGEYNLFQKEYKEACRLYDANDPELIRLSAFASFMTEE